MTKPKTNAPLKLVAFDAARYLDDDAAIAEYMTAVLEGSRSHGLRSGEQGQVAPSRDLIR